MKGSFILCVERKRKWRGTHEFDNDDERTV